MLFTYQCEKLTIFTKPPSNNNNVEGAMVNVGKNQGSLVNWFVWTIQSAISAENDGWKWWENECSKRYLEAICMLQ